MDPHLITIILTTTTTYDGLGASWAMGKTPDLNSFIVTTTLEVWFYSCSQLPGVGIRLRGAQ